MISEFQNYGSRRFVVCLIFKSRQWERSRKSTNGLICKAIMILPRSVLKQNCKAFISTCQWRVSCAQITCVKNESFIQQHLCAWTTFSLSLLNDSKTKSRSHLTVGRFKSIMTRFPGITHREQKSSPGPNNAYSPANLLSSLGTFWPICSLLILATQNPIYFP